MAQRNITEEQVEETIHNPDKVTQDDNQEAAHYQKEYQDVNPDHGNKMGTYILNVVVLPFKLLVSTVYRMKSFKK